MSIKIKSLIYLGCFVLAAIIYEQSSKEPSANLLNSTTEIAETHSSNKVDSNTLETTRIK